MSFALKAKALEKLAIDNSPAILTAVGVVGTVATAILSHKAALKADDILLGREAHEIQMKQDEVLSKKQKVQLLWKVYIPPVAMGTITIVSIVGANRIGTKRAAAVAAAYSLSEKAFSEYREKVAEKFGESKAQGVRDDLARDYVRDNPPQESNVVIVGSGEVLCCDLFSGRYFNSAMEELKKAQNDTNYQIIADGYASLTDFWCRVGLPRTAISDEIGWNQDKELQLEFTTVLSEDGRPCIAYTFRSNPLARFDQFHP